MNNLTERIMSALAPEVRETLPKEWFTRVCKCCFDKYTPEVDAVQFADNCWRGQPIFPRDHHIYTGPDLTDPRNLHALLLVCDAVDIGSVDLCQTGEGFVCWLYTDISTEYSGTGPDRTTAALDALCKALGVEAIEAAYREGSNDGVFNENDNTSKPGRFFCDSRARRAAQRIGGDHG